MAPIRAARAHPSRSYDEAGSDSGGDTEPDSTPRPAKPNRTASKRRLSEFAEQDAEASFVSDSSRAPLKTVNINDDAAEKRRRRKSAKLTMVADEDSGQPQAGPSSEPVATGAQLGAGRNVQRLQSITQAPAAEAPVNVDPNNFEEWMKMATDNKINATNSWNFALIDYFHDMSLLRNTGDNSINFQRASCTLDGCVKIWTSRVDSVGTETGKLLSNLVQEGRISADDDEDADLDNPDAEPGSQARARRKRGPATTLAKDASQLKSKKLDVEFSVDPLFKKTCADFDEGGAHGLLMNHLALSITPEGGMRMIFDASDAIPKPAEEDEDLTEAVEEDVDLSHLRSTFLPDLDALEEKMISHSLAGFTFLQNTSFDDTALFQNIGVDDDESDHGNVGFPSADDPMDFEGAPPVEDFFAEDQGGGDVLGGGGMDDFGTPPFDDGENGSVGAVAAEHGTGGGPATFVPFDPRRAPNQKDLVMAMTDGDGGMLDYFDQTFLKNWAGPQHWKLRRAVKKPEAGADPAPKAKREKKEAFRIDFLTPAEKDLKEVTTSLFAPVKRGAGINLPGTAKSRRGKAATAARDNASYLLPDDMHFSSRQLVSLFLKPKFSLKMRGQRAPLEVNAEGEIDENFWAQAAANQAAQQTEDVEADDTGAMPFNTQFFHDDDDDAGFDDAFDGEGGGSAAPQDPGEQDLLAATQGQTRRVKPEFVNYAKRAKRVDVRRLKDNIWKGLDIIVPPPKAEDDMDEDGVQDEDVTGPTEARQFSTVVNGLRSVYVKEKMEEISTSFCFICLLHLANERGLKLEGGEEGMIAAVEDDDELDTSAIKTTDKGVGDIWSLKVYRDPHAIPSA